MKDTAYPISSETFSTQTPEIDLTHPLEKKYDLPSNIAPEFAKWRQRFDHSAHPNNQEPFIDIKNLALLLKKFFTTDYSNNSKLDPEDWAVMVKAVEMRMELLLRMNRNENKRIMSDEIKKDILSAISIGQKKNLNNDQIIELHVELVNVLNNHSDHITHKQFLELIKKVVTEEYSVLALSALSSLMDYEMHFLLLRTEIVHLNSLLHLLNTLKTYFPELDAIVHDSKIIVCEDHAYPSFQLKIQAIKHIFNSQIEDKLKLIYDDFKTNYQIIIQNEKARELLSNLSVDDIFKNTEVFLSVFNALKQLGIQSSLIDSTLALITSLTLIPVISMEKEILIPLFFCHKFFSEPDPQLQTLRLNQLNFEKDFNDLKTRNTNKDKSSNIEKFPIFFAKQIKSEDSKNALTKLSEENNDIEKPELNNEDTEFFNSAPN